MTNINDELIFCSLKWKKNSIYLETPGWNSLKCVSMFSAAVFFGRIFILALNDRYDVILNKTLKKLKVYLSPWLISHFVLTKIKSILIICFYLNVEYLMQNNIVKYYVCNFFFIVLFHVNNTFVYLLYFFLVK